MEAIRVENVTKLFKRYAYKRQFQTFKSALLKGDFFKNIKPEETFAALKDVSFSVEQGETFGIIGNNGSGKSSLLKIIAGITKPTYGKVKSNGKISALIELGAGFHPEITGRENVYINGIMLGLAKKEIQQKFDEIVRFAELEEFINAPVKTYSSGMFMRLGFSIAVNVNPEILLIDEVLAVGDEAFAHKCIDKMLDFKRRKKTILLVTHALSMVETFCDRALWLKNGRIQKIGDPKAVTDAYLMDVASSEEIEIRQNQQEALSSLTNQESSKQNSLKEVDERKPSRWGDRQIEITNVLLLDSNNNVKYIYSTGEAMRILIKILAHQKIDDFVFGIGIFNSEGISCYGSNTHIEEFKPISIKGEAEVECFIPNLNLIEGTYFLDVAVHKRNGYPYDYHHNLYSFKIRSRIKDVGIARIPHKWKFSPNIIIEAPQFTEAR